MGHRRRILPDGLAWKEEMAYGAGMKYQRGTRGTMTSDHTAGKNHEGKNPFRGREEQSMSRKLFSVIGAVVMTAAFAVPSWAQDHNTISLRDTSGAATTAIQFAKEIFPEDSDPEIDLNRTTVRLTYLFGANNVANGRVADVTYELSAGTFADAPAKPVYTPTGDGMQSHLTVSDGTGAEVGSSSVTYRITSAAVLDDNATLDFVLPRLIGVASTLRGPDTADGPPSINVMVTVRPLFATQAQAFPMFPPMNDPDAGTIAAATSANFVRFADTDPDMMGTQMSNPPQGATTTAAIINTDDPTMLSAVAGQSRAVSGVPGGATIGVIVSQVQVGLAGNLKTADGTTNLGAQMGDKFIIRAEGDFAAGDVLFYDYQPTFDAGVDPDNVYAAAEALTITGRTARLEIELTAAQADNSLATLYYVPASGVALSEKTISSSYTIDLRQNQGAYGMRVVQAGNVRTSFSGITTRGYAYAVPNPRGTDVGNLRIRCQGGSPCNVYLRCMDMEGSVVGDGNLKNMEIAGGATVHLGTKSSLPSLLGISTWTGRLACDILADNEISVQFLVRSGNTLTNNTYIGGELTNK